MSQSLTNSPLDQELLTSKRAPKAANAIETDDSSGKSSLTTKILLAYFYLNLALLSFLAFLLPKLPFTQIAESTLNYLSVQTPYVWKSAATELHFFWPPYVQLKGLSLTSKPFGAGSRETPQKISIENVSLTPYVFSSMPIPGMKPFSPAAGFSFQLFQGNGSGSFSLTNAADLQLDLSAEKFNLEKMAPAIHAEDLDLKGLVQSMAVNIVVAQSKLSKANGSAALTIKGMQLDPAGFNVGMPLPILALGDVKLQASIKNGRLSLDHSTIGGPSADIEAFIDGDIILREPVEFSEIALKLRLKLASKITQVLPYVESFLAAGKRPDGYYGLKLSGTLASPGIPQPYNGN